MNNSMNKSLVNLIYGAAIAAIYVVLTMIFAPVSFGAVQFRISEALCVLPVFTPAAVPGIFVGCFLANLLAGAAPADIIFGSLASLIGAYFTYRLRGHKLLPLLPPIIANALIVPFILRYAYGVEDMLWFMMITVGIGEVLAVGVLGSILRAALSKYERVIFGRALA